MTCTGPFGAFCSDKSFDRVPWRSLGANDTVTEGLQGDHGLNGTSLGLFSSDIAIEGHAVASVLRPNLLMMQNRVLHLVGVIWLVGLARHALVSLKQTVPEPTFLNNCLLLVGALAGAGGVSSPPPYLLGALSFELPRYGLVLKGPAYRS